MNFKATVPVDRRGEHPPPASPCPSLIKAAQWPVNAPPFQARAWVTVAGWVLASPPCGGGRRPQTAAEFTPAHSWCYNRHFHKEAGRTGWMAREESRYLLFWISNDDQKWFLSKGVWVFSKARVINILSPEMLWDFQLGLCLCPISSPPGLMRNICPSAVHMQNLESAHEVKAGSNKFPPSYALKLFIW